MMLLLVFVISDSERSKEFICVFSHFFLKISFEVEKCSNQFNEDDVWYWRQRGIFNKFGMSLGENWKKPKISNTPFLV